LRGEGENAVVGSSALPLLRLRFRLGSTLLSRRRSFLGSLLEEPLFSSEGFGTSACARDGVCGSSEFSWESGRFLRRSLFLLVEERPEKPRSPDRFRLDRRLGGSDLPGDTVDALSRGHSPSSDDDDIYPVSSGFSRRDPLGFREEDRARGLELARDLDLALDLDRALDFDLARDWDRVGDLDLVRDLDGVGDLDRAREEDRTRDWDRVREEDEAMAEEDVSVREDLDRALDLDRAREEDRTLDLDRAREEDEAMAEEEVSVREDSSGAAILEESSFFGGLYRLVWFLDLGSEDGDRMDSARMPWLSPDFFESFLHLHLVLEDEDRRGSSGMPGFSLDFFERFLHLNLGLEDEDREENSSGRPALPVCFRLRASSICSGVFLDRLGRYLAAWSSSSLTVLLMVLAVFLLLSLMISFVSELSEAHSFSNEDELFPAGSGDFCPPCNKVTSLVLTFLMVAGDDRCCCSCNFCCCRWSCSC
jgi:hypothetical protein